jgi:outer membrane receptor protein involved in Fe transport
MNNSIKSGLWAAASATALFAGAAFADEAPAPAATGVQEIIVTSQLREQKLIDVPMTVTAFTGKQLDSLGVQDLHTLSLQTPGFYFENHSVDDSPVVMRGISDGSTDPTDEPRISIYQDGVSISEIVAAYTELFDVQRVEVAEGPQTTLYGRSAETGAVNIIQNKASEAGFEAYLRADGGDYGYRRFEGMINMPIGDKLAIRIAAVDKQRNGYIANDAGGAALESVDTQAVRVALNYHPDASLNDDFIVNYENDNPTGVDFKSTTFAPTNPVTGQTLGNLSPFSSAFQGSSPLLENGAEPNIKRMVLSATNILTYHFDGGFKLTSTTAYRHFYDYDVLDPTGFGFPILTAGTAEHATEYSQDVRVNYDRGGRFSAFAGVSVFSDQLDATTTEVFDEPLALALLTGVLNRTNPNPGPESTFTNAKLEAGELQGLAAAGGLNLPGAQALGIANNLSPDHEETGAEESRTTAFDAYFDGTFRATDKLEFSAGVRFTNEEKTTKYAGTVDGRSVLGGVIGAQELGQASGLQASTTGNCASAAVLAKNSLCQLLAGLAQPGANGLTGPLPLFGVQIQPTPGNGDKQAAYLADNGASWRATARYKATDDLDIYFNYARGLRPAVLSVEGPSTPGGDARFAVAPAETLSSFEFGAKSRLLDGHLALDGDVYFYNYNNFQTTVLEGTQFVTENAGNADAYGFEGRATWAATNRLNLYATYAFTHTEFLNGAFEGNQFPLSPENTFTIGAAYRFPAPGGSFSFNPNFRWQSKIFFEDSDDNLAELQGAIIAPLQSNLDQAAYSVLNLRLTYTPTVGNWTVAAFVNNATDTHYLIQRGGTGLDLGIPTDIPAEPLTFGGSVTYHW